MRYFLFAFLLVLAGCTKKNDSNENESTSEEVLPPPPGITPVPLPDPHIPGFVFPEKEETINKWIQANDTKAMAQHAWGIWTALTSKSGSRLSGEDLLVYETWSTPEEVRNTILSPQDENVNTFILEQLPTRKRQKLFPPKQFERAGQLEMFSPEARSISPLVSVAFDPKAADFIVTNKLLRKSVLQAMLQQGKADIPDFPNEAISIKPVYQIIPGPNRATELFQLKVWTQNTDRPVAFPPDKWPSCVYIDVKNNGKAKNAVALNCAASTPETTYNVSEFIHYTLTEADLETVPNSIDAQAGDVAVLIAMHVTSKEIKRWTWATFWWSPNPDAPVDPSSKAIADARPAELKGAPKHYSCSIGNTFIVPDQPLTGGNNKGTSVYAFNPYLEAGFSGFEEKAMVKTGTILVVNNVGVRTNCMSCHAQANFSLRPDAPGYIGDTYIDMNDRKFKSTLRVDFLWSIVGSDMIEDQ